MTENSHTEPSEATLSEEEAESKASHGADQELTPEQDAAAPAHASAGTAEHYQEMAEKGANVPGEGELP